MIFKTAQQNLSHLTETFRMICHLQFKFYFVSFLQGSDVVVNLSSSLGDDIRNSERGNKGLKSCLTKLTPIFGPFLLLFFGSVFTVVMLT